MPKGKKHAAVRQTRITDVSLSVTPTAASPRAFGVQLKTRNHLPTELLRGEPLLPAQGAVPQGCKVKLKTGFKNMSPDEKAAELERKKRPWQIDVIFLSEKNAAKRGGVAGPAVRLCTGFGQPGPIVPVRSPDDVVGLARRLKECVEAGRDKKHCAVEVAGPGAALGGFHYSRKRGRFQRRARDFGW